MVVCDLQRPAAHSEATTVLRLAQNVLFSLPVQDKEIKSDLYLLFFFVCNFTHFRSK